MSKLTISSIADVMNALNNPELIQDLPEFKTFPAGAYEFSLEKMEVKDLGKDGVVRPAIVILLGEASVMQFQGQDSMSSEELAELTDSVTNGQFYKAYFTQAKDSTEASRDMGAFKKHWIPLMQERGETAEQFMETILAAKQSESPLKILVELSKTKGKNQNEDGSYPYYNNIETIAFAG